MLREFTKSVVSFSWALSLLGIKQATNLFRPDQQRGSDLLNPVTQAAISQFDESLKSFYRSGDMMQSRAVDMGLAWMNPGTWFNWAGRNVARPNGAYSEKTTEQPLNGEHRSGQAGSISDFVAFWMNPINVINRAGCRDGCSNDKTRQTNGVYSVTNQPDTGNGSSSGNATAGWGPMPGQSS